jgi:hypothetical protein
MISSFRTRLGHVHSRLDDAGLVTALNIQMMMLGEERWSSVNLAQPQPNLCIREASKAALLPLNIDDIAFFGKACYTAHHASGKTRWMCSGRLLSCQRLSSMREV